MVNALNFTPCSPRHKSCSPAHADLVSNYRSERWRQEQDREARTGGYLGDIAHEEAKGRNLIDFHAWLKAHRRNHA